MRTLNRLPVSLCVRSLGIALGGFALISAGACSSDNEGTAASNAPLPYAGPGTTVNNNQPGVNVDGTTGSLADPVNGDATGMNPGNGTNETGQTAEGLDNGAGGAGMGAMAGATAGAGMGAGGASMVADVGPVVGYFESGEWRGYAYSTAVGVGTTATPVDFSGVGVDAPYCLAGSVGPDALFGGVSLMGFSINQEAFGVDGAAPVAATIVPEGTGIAINFQKTLASTLRIQIQGPTGETNENDRWCYEIEDVIGPVFAPYNEFNTRCYGVDGDLGNPRGTDYNMEPLTTVSFLVPGDNLVAVDYNYCVDGFADGNSIADAPESIGSTGGPITGTLETNFRRAKVLSPDGKSYIVQNNAWNEGAREGAQQLSFSGNSFAVTIQTNPDFGNIPISFPSIFIGHNGSPINSNSLATTADDNLPRSLAQVTSVQSTFNHNGGNVQGQYNATYDIWFANNEPTATYDDAQAAFLMVWLHKPPQNPIGLNPRFSNVTVPGVNGNWDIWVGNRGENGAEANLNDNAPVISYLPAGGGTINNFSEDLKNFMNDAVGRNIGLNNNMVLTDIFGGFEIWNGGQGLQLTEFTADVQ